MRKIPTMFKRDWDGDPSRVVNQPHPECWWVFAGEGIARQKLDGTCCMIRDGKLWKRREVKQGKSLPPDFEIVEQDDATGKSVGWVPVGDGAEDRYYREAFDPSLPDGTYELVGPKVQGNPEGLLHHALVRHDTIEAYPDAPRTFDGLRDWFAGRDIEGIVFHHPDGRMAKIKLQDFGLKRH